MTQLLSEASARGIMSDYTGKLLAAFDFEKCKSEDKPDVSSAVAGGQLLDELLIVPLSERELEVLKLLAKGLSNRQISERLFLALSTVKGHNRTLFGKLQVQSRTKAIARARELGLL